MDAHVVAGTGSDLRPDLRRNRELFTAPGHARLGPGSACLPVCRAIGARARGNLDAKSSSHSSPKENPKANAPSRSWPPRRQDFVEHSAGPLRIFVCPRCRPRAGPKIAKTGEAPWNNFFKI